MPLHTTGTSTSAHDAIEPACPRDGETAGGETAGGATTSVAIVGAGCAGTLTALKLLRSGGRTLRVVLVERDGRFGPGVAYDTCDPRHRLNVVAERMSAFEDVPDHFRVWAERRLGCRQAAAYLPRMHYGAYLRELLDDAARAAPGRLERIAGEAIDVRPASGGAVVALRYGRRIAADHVVLALGGLPPAPPVALPDDPRVVADPWAAGAPAPAPPGATTLLVGSGLTAVDVALSACATDARSRVVAISRGGCLPFDHLPGLRAPAPPPAPPGAAATVASLERWLRCHVRDMEAAGYDWRDAVDGLRPLVPRLWRSLPHDERRGFMRTRARAWDLRRHRMAPEVAAEVRGLLAAGRLLVRPGRVVGVRARPETVETLVVAGDGELRTLRTDRVVVCAGPGQDVRRASSPLLRSLLDRGVACADPLALGLRATPEGRLLAPDGRPHAALHLLGPLRRGELWETTAVREIRAQADTIARAIGAVPAGRS